MLGENKIENAGHGDKRWTQVPSRQEDKKATVQSLPLQDGEGARERDGLKG